MAGAWPRPTTASLAWRNHSKSRDRVVTANGTSVAVASVRLLVSHHQRRPPMKKKYIEQTKRLDLRRETLRSITGGVTTRPTMEPPSESTNVWCATSTRPTSDVHCI